MAKEEKVKKKVKRPSAEKRALQSEKNRLRNKAFRSSVRTAIRKLDDAIEQKNAELTKSQLSAVFSIMDKGVKFGIFKLNKSSRTKARLTARVAAQAVA